MKKFKLGDKVKFIKVVQKKKVKVSSHKYSDSITSHIEKSLLIEQEGIICGKRTLTNGKTTWEDMSDGDVYSPTTSSNMARFFDSESATVVYLVATNLSRNPSKVSVEHLIEYNK